MLGITIQFDIVMSGKQCETTVYINQHHTVSMKQLRSFIHIHVGMYIFLINAFISLANMQMQFLHRFKYYTLPSLVFRCRSIRYIMTVSVVTANMSVQCVEGREETVVISFKELQV